MDRERRRRVLVGASWTLTGLSATIAVWALTLGDRDPIGAFWSVLAAPVYLAPALLGAVLALTGRRVRPLVASAVVGFGIVWTCCELRWRPTPDALDGVVVRVMTYNVAMAAGGIGPIAQTIREQNADVVCLQEADAYPALGRVPQALQRALPEYDFRWHGQMVVASRLPVERTEIVGLSDSPLARPAFVAHVRAGDRSVAVASVHLVPNGWDVLRNAPRPLSEALTVVPRIRARQVAELRKWAERHAHVIVAGDFNFQPFGPNHRELDSTMDDAFAVAGRGLGFSLTTKWPTKRVDQIWTRAVRPVRCWMPRSAASDHNPMVADLLVPAG